MGRVCHRNGRLCQRGVTTFMEMPLNQIPATVDKTSLEIKYKAGENKLKVDVGSFGGVVPTNLADGIQELDEGGVSGYKCFWERAAIVQLKEIFKMSTIIHYMKE